MSQVVRTTPRTHNVANEPDQTALPECPECPTCDCCCKQMVNEFSIPFVAAAGEYIQMDVSDATFAFTHTHPFSISFWVYKPEGRTALGPIIERTGYDGGDTKPTGWGVSIDATQHVQAFLHSDTFGDATNVNALVTRVCSDPVGNQVWEHYLIVYSGDATSASMSIYKNGVLANGATSTTAWTGTAIPAASEHFSIGRGVNTAAAAAYLDSFIDNIAVFNSSLTLADAEYLSGRQFAGKYGNALTSVPEITWKVVDGKNVSCPQGLIEWWRCGDHVDDKLSAATSASPSSPKLAGSYLAKNGVPQAFAIPFAPIAPIPTLCDEFAGRGWRWNYSAPTMVGFPPEVTVFSGTQNQWDNITSSLPTSALDGGKYQALRAAQVGYLSGYPRLSAAELPVGAFTRNALSPVQMLPLPVGDNADFQGWWYGNSATHIESHGARFTGQMLVVSLGSAAGSTRCMIFDINTGAWTLKTAHTENVVYNVGFAAVMAYVPSSTTEVGLHTLSWGSQGSQKTGHGVFSITNNSWSTPNAKPNVFIKGTIACSSPNNFDALKRDRIYAAAHGGTDYYHYTPSTDTWSAAIAFPANNKTFDSSSVCMDPFTGDVYWILLQLDPQKYTLHKWDVSGQAWSLLADPPMATGGTDVDLWDGQAGSRMWAWIPPEGDVNNQKFLLMTQSRFTEKWRVYDPQSNTWSDSGPTTIGLSGTLDEEQKRDWFKSGPVFDLIPRKI